MLRLRLAALAAVCMLAACGGGTEGLLGQDLYERSCAACHGRDGAGGGAGPAVGAASNAVELSDEQLAGVIRVGPGTMPSFDRLSDEQVSSLVTYMRTLQGE